MQKSSPLQTHIDEGRLHPRQNTGHLAQVNIANQATLQRSLHVQFLKGAVFNHRHTGFLGRPIDQDILLNAHQSPFQGGFNNSAVSYTGKPMMPE